MLHTLLPFYGPSFDCWGNFSILLEGHDSIDRDFCDRFPFRDGWSYHEYHVLTMAGTGRFQWLPCSPTQPATTPPALRRERRGDGRAVWLGGVGPLRPQKWRIWHGKWEKHQQRWGCPDQTWGFNLIFACRHVVWIRQRIFTTKSGTFAAGTNIWVWKQSRLGTGWWFLGFKRDTFRAPNELTTDFRFLSWKLAPELHRNREWSRIGAERPVKNGQWSLSG